MFERATIFSALIVLIFFGVLADKYLDFMTAKNSATPTPTSANSSLKTTKK